MLTAKQLSYIKDLLNKELAEIEERNREKMGEMESMKNDSETFHGDEADQANFMEERNRQLRMRDRDRKLINKIRVSISAWRSANLMQSILILRQVTLKWGSMPHPITVF